MIVRSELNKNQQPTPEQIQEIHDAAKKPIVYDEDSPELTDAMKKAFVLAARNRNRMRGIS